MPQRRVSPLPVALLAAVSLLLGGFAAWTEADGDTPAPATTPAARAPGPAATTPAAPAAVEPAPACPPNASMPAAEPVPQDILDAFGVLRRPTTAQDALPAQALSALRARGLEPFDPAAARLLRTTADGGEAWVVPVRDATARPAPFLCLPRAAARPTPTAPPKARRTPAARPTPTPKARRNRTRTSAARSVAKAKARRNRTRTAAPRPVPKTPPAVAVVPARPQAAVPLTTRPQTTTPAPGLAVVALGGAPAGGGGILADLVRGRAAVTTTPCGGPGGDLLTVSGIVPDGVAAAFLTAQDGTAVRADVQDNAYAFVVPRPKQAEQRYVVWTGGDGTPHVQPLRTLTVPAGVRCAAPPASVAQVSPEPTAACDLYAGMAVPVARAPRVTRVPRRGAAVPAPATTPARVPVPPPVVYAAPALCATTVLRLPAPAAEPVPVPRRP